MTNFLTAIKVLLQLLPLIHEGVAALEQAIPQSGKGAVKLATLKNWIQQAFDTLQIATVQFEAIWKLAEPVIAAIVAATTKK